MSGTAKACRYSQKKVTHAPIYHTIIPMISPRSLKLVLSHKKNLVSKTLIGSALRLQIHFLYLISLLKHDVQHLQLHLSPPFSFFCTSRNFK